MGVWHTNVLTSEKLQTKTMTQGQPRDKDKLGMSGGVAGAVDDGSVLGKYGWEALRLRFPELCDNDFDFSQQNVSIEQLLVVDCDDLA